MWEIHSTEKIRIKDIAEKAGVSVGTVDRVLHNRPNVSIKSREKVENILKQINYQPNMYASALAANRKYTFCCLLPDLPHNAYWAQVKAGIEKAIKDLSDFRISLKTLYYSQNIAQSFSDKAKQLTEIKTDGVVIVPQSTTETYKYCQKLKQENIPFVFLDTNIPDIQPLAFYAQNSLKSGYFAGRIIMTNTTSDNKKIMLMRMISDGKVVSRQQEYREVGFRKYIEENFPETEIIELNLTLKDNEDYNTEINNFFELHPDISKGITFCSRAYILGEYLMKHPEKKISLFGYDMIEKNVECLKKGTVDFIIAQHPWKQGYSCINALFDHIVLKKEVRQENYMPIELLTAENYEFYKHEEK